MIDIPYHVEQEPVVENRVIINRSNNWDVSRKVYATPAIPVQEVAGMAIQVEKDSSSVLVFQEGQEAESYLKAHATVLDKNREYVIDSFGHSEKESKDAGVKAGKWLMSKGYRISEVRYFLGDRKIEVKEGFGKGTYTPVK